MIYHVFPCHAQTLELLAGDGFYEIKDVLNLKELNRNTSTDIKSSI